MAQEAARAGGFEIVERPSRAGRGGKDTQNENDKLFNALRELEPGKAIRLTVPDGCEGFGYITNLRSLMSYRIAKAGLMLRPCIQYSQFDEDRSVYISLVEKKRD